ncbi:splicing factor 3B, subunit 5 [Lipomyces tetrasporus]|uniref:Splicing factor subunit n=1 Tax=Lipomyces tetrasporus TaxID=54092 RepID=A0AAD7VVD8_9ASCO|nr:splicing factor 3B, subunit 5 [Lipomyces tetrasporus]KAJ8102864.1 splicing factor 3B, subunit 5 [Lipomyces tetrasporus]
MADKLRAQQQLEQLQTRYVGVGHADTTKQYGSHFFSQLEWLSNVQRDSLAAYIGHPAMLEHFSVALNEPQERVRVQFIDKMIQPCGPPKDKEEI